jgi:hypothetical protein
MINRRHTFFTFVYVYSSCSDIRSMFRHARANQIGSSGVLRLIFTGLSAADLKPVPQVLFVSSDGTMHCTNPFRKWLPRRHFYALSQCQGCVLCSILHLVGNKQRLLAAWWGRLFQ